MLGSRKIFLFPNFSSITIEKNEAAPKLYFFLLLIFSPEKKCFQHHTLKNVGCCRSATMAFYLKTYGGQISNLYLNFVLFSTQVLVRHL